jgi:hypothetical protein
VDYAGGMPSAEDREAYLSICRTAGSDAELPVPNPVSMSASATMRQLRRPAVGDTSLYWVAGFPGLSSFAHAMQHEQP